MSVAELKEELHNTIDSIEDASFLEAMLTIAHAQSKLYDDPLTEEQIQILKEREALYQRGEMKAIPWEEVQARIKAKHGF